MTEQELNNLATKIVTRLMRLKTVEDFFKHITKSDVANAVDYENLDYKSYQNFSKDLVNNADLINQIQITGGEPFQIPKVWQFLMEDMPKDKAKNINLCFDTNFTDLNWKNYTFEHLLDRYKKVLLNVSISWSNLDIYINNPNAIVN